MLYQKHRNPSQATQKKTRGIYFNENQRQESSRRSSCFWRVTAFGRGSSWRIPGREIEESEVGGAFVPSTPAEVYPVVGFGSRKVCWFPQYSQVKMSVSAEITVRPPHEGQSRVMTSNINAPPELNTLLSIVYLQNPTAGRGNCLQFCLPSKYSQSYFPLPHMSCTLSFNIIITAQPCHCEAVFAEAVSRFFSENDLLEIASSQKTLLPMTKVDVFYDG